MKKMIFLDLDGTLWTNERIPLSASTALFNAKANGHKIFVNTGRTYSEAIVPLLPLPFDGYCFSAGSEIYVGDETIVFEPLRSKDAETMMRFLLDHRVGVTLEGSKISYLDPINFDFFKQRMELESDSDAFQRFLALPSIDSIQSKDYQQFMKLYLYNPNGVSVSTIRSCIPERAELTVFQGHTGEITNAKNNKGTAIQKVKEYFNDEYEVVAIGDSENDVSMLRAADIAISMGNGSKEAKQCADFITTSIDQDGVYHAFERLGLLG